MFQSAANNVTITNGVNENAPTVWGRDPRNPDGSGSGTFESDGIGAFCGWASSNSGHLAYSFQLSGWYAHGMYQRGTHGLALDGIWDGVRVDHNWVYNSVKGGGQNLAYSSIYTPPNCSGSGECNWDGVGFLFGGGIANARVTHNFIDWTGNDGIYAFWNDAVSNDFYHVCNNVTIANNVFNKIQRIAVEMQSVSSGCSGGCKTYSPGSNYTVQSNWDRTHFFPTTNSWSFSINNNYQGYRFLNNSMTFGTRSDGSNQPMYYGYTGWESAIQGGIGQGNVWSVDQQTFPHYTDPSSNGRSGTYVQKINNWQSESAAGSNYNVQENNNLLCGGGSSGGLTGQTLGDRTGGKVVFTQQTQWVGPDGRKTMRTTTIRNTYYPRFTFTSNYQQANCPYAGSVDKSNISGGFSSSNNQAFPNAD